jgi:hypothetical protein
MMNIGLILPARPENKKESGIFFWIFKALGSVMFNKLRLETHHIELLDGLNLVICSIPVNKPEMISHEGVLKKLKAKLEKKFEEERAWPILEHPAVKGLINPQEFRFDETIAEVAIDRFPEVLKLMQGIGDLCTKEVTVTGGSSYLEYAISKLITKVKTLNLLLPEGSCEPGEAEQAFVETGIPVHITSDSEVLNRTAVWLRFPDDDVSFDSLPESFHGMIADFSAMKIIDTRNKKIFTVTLEFSDKIKRKIGHSNLDGWGKGVLEGVIITVCANAWDIGVTDTSIRLGMRLSFNS